MNAQNQSLIQKRLTPGLVEQIMGLEAGRIQAVAWLVMQEEAAGETGKSIAEKLGVGEDQLIALKMDTCGVDEEGKLGDTWMKGVIALRTAGALNQHSIATGWDALEAMALEKLNSQMAAMQSNGNPEQMLAIATAANKATRRGAGEMAGRGGAGGSIMSKAAEIGPGGFNMELSAGNLGTIRLQLSPKIREQLANPSKVIEAVANNAQFARTKMTDGIDMLKLTETRALLNENGTVKDEDRTLDPKKKMFDLSEIEADLDV